MSSHVAASDRDLTIDIFVQIYGVVCVGEHGLRQVFRQSGEVAAASDISLQQTQVRTDGRVFVGGFYAADHDFTPAYVEFDLATSVYAQNWRTDLGSVTCPFEVSVAISWMAGMCVLPNVLNEG